MLLGENNQIVMNLQTIPKIICSHCPEYSNKISKLDVLKGLTNITYKVSADGLPALVFRKFGGMIDRTQENLIYDQLQKMKVAPKCLYACQKYRIEVFIENAKHPSNQQLMDERLIGRIIKKIHNFHQLMLPNHKQSMTLVEELVIQQQYKRVSCLKNNKKVDKFQTLKQSIMARMADTSQMQKIVPLNKNTIRFCHNDLNNLNILVTDHQVVLIDFQYSKLNYFSYDIANFLNESTIDYVVETFPGFKLIRTLTLTDIHQAASEYPQNYQELTEDILRTLCACNLYWAIWSIIGAVNPNQGIFSIVEHGIMRIKLYDQYMLLLDKYLQSKSNKLQ